MPETGDGETRGQFGAAPAPRRVPGRPAADRAPGAAAVAAPAAGARPGSASWGGSEGRGTDGRASGRARARGRTGGHALSREGVTGSALVKGAVHFEGPTGQTQGKSAADTQGEQKAGTWENYRSTGAGEGGGGPPRGLRSEPRTSPPSEALLEGGACR